MFVSFCCFPLYITESIVRGEAFFLYCKLAVVMKRSIGRASTFQSLNLVFFSWRNNSWQLHKALKLSFTYPLLIYGECVCYHSHGFTYKWAHFLKGIMILRCPLGFPNLGIVSQRKIMLHLPSSHLQCGFQMLPSLNSLTVAWKNLLSYKKKKVHFKRNKE